jgi:hypothetical protein
VEYHISSYIWPAMAPGDLTVEQKHQLCEHKTSIEEDGRKFPYKDQLGAEIEFTFEKKIAAPLNRMTIERMRHKAQSTLDAFLR